MKKLIIILFICGLLLTASDHRINDNKLTIKSSGAVVVTNTGGLEGTPIAGALEYVGSRLYITNVAHQRVIDRSDCVVLETVTVDGDVEGTTETTIWTCAMEANSLVAGNVLRFTGIGIASNDNSGDILTVRIYVGANETPVVTLTNAARTFTDDDLHINGYATQRTIGTSGSRAVHIDMSIGVDTSTLSAVATINTEIDMTITITAQWDTADADNILTFQQGWMTFKN